MNQSKNVDRTQKLIESKDLLFVWRLILKNIGFIILVPVIAYFVGYIYTYRLTDIHGSKVQLLLKSNETYDYQDQIYKGLGAYGVYMDAQNQMRIIQSRDLIGEVIDKVNIFTSYYVVGRIRKKEVFETLPFRSDVEVINGSVYEKPIKVFILDKETYRIDYEVNGKMISIKHKFDEILINDDFKLVLLKNYAFTDKNIKSISDYEYEIVFHSRDYLINKYRSRIGIENVEYTSILEIQLLDELQYRGKRFLDTLTAVYIDYSRRIQLEVNQNTISNIEKQIDTIASFIESKEEELMSFKSKHDILNLPKEEEEYFERIVETGKEKRELSEKINDLKVFESYIINLNNEHFLPPTFTTLNNDLYLTQTIKKVYELQLKLTSNSSSQLEGNFYIEKLKSEINSLKRDALIYINNLEESTKGKLKIANDYLAKNKSKIKQIPESTQGEANIKRDLEVNTRMYLYLLEKKTNALIARAGIIPQVRLVETASNMGVVQPDKRKIVNMFLLGGVLLAFFIAILRKLFFEKIENVSELAESTSLSVLGGLPFVKEKESKLIVRNKPKAQITESFRTLRTNLSYLGDFSKEKKAQKILISSFFPGEGKTFTSTNVASIMAMSDKKVVIVDFDLHKPKIHKTFEIENLKGISSYLIGKNDLEDIINKDLSPNLDVITAGPIPPNPSELILKSRMSDLFEKLEKEYDYIIIDTPPFGLLNDSIELIKYLDVFLIILNTKYIKIRGLRTIEAMFEKYDDISVGVVLNGVKRTRFQYYYSKYSYKYNYNYGYNYGYGYGELYSDYVEKE